MSLYKEFSTLFPYLQSVRKIQNYLSFDISFPITWKLPKKYVDEKKIMEQESQIKNERLFSYVSQINEEDIEIVYNNLKNIIKYNLEREEKDRLFEVKVDELKKLFEKQNLEKLKGLYFDISEPTQKIKLDDDDEEQISTTGLVRETDPEGQK
jgi:hypothetical protein